MRAIEPTLTSELRQHVRNAKVDKAEPYEVTTYRRLMEQIARLAYLNKDHLLFFRGQSSDYLNRAGGSTFYPSIYRGDRLPAREVSYRFQILEQAGRLVAEAFDSEGIEGAKDIRRKRFIQWSILQHYEVCATPLLDFTHSVRVACSFAQLNATEDSCFVFVFGLPYITNRISVNSEHDLINVRLLSICPPDALRPYYQDGYLVGTDDIEADYETKGELDFRHRLIAKFRIPKGSRFWGSGFTAIPSAVLYPPGDRIDKLCSGLRVEVEADLQSGEVGDFLKAWSSLEDYLAAFRQEGRRTTSLHRAMEKMLRELDLPKDTAREFHTVRQFRNRLVHRPKTVEPGEIQEFINRARNLAGRVRRVGSGDA